MPAPLRGRKVTGRPTPLRINSEQFRLPIRMCSADPPETLLSMGLLETINSSGFRTDWLRACKPDAFVHPNQTHLGFGVSHVHEI